MRLSRRSGDIVVAFLCAGLWAQQPAKQPATLALEDVITLVHAGVAEDVVVAQIKRYNKPFDLNADEILELRKKGVSDTIIRYLFDPTAPYVPAPAQPLAAAPKPKTTPPSDPLTSKIPPEPGLYWLAVSDPGQEKFELIELKSLVPKKIGGKSGSLLTRGLKKEHTLGFLVGTASKRRVKTAPYVFYGRLGATAVEDVFLLRMDKGDNRRTVDFGPKPEKPVFPEDSLRPFDSKLVDEGLYRLEVASLSPGEYVFLILGSGDEKKGILGKGYDFGVDPPGKEK